MYLRDDDHVLTKIFCCLECPGLFYKTNKTAITMSIVCHKQKTQCLHEMDFSMEISYTFQ